MPPVDLTLLRGVRSELKNARSEHDKLSDALAERSAEITRLDGEIEQLAARGDAAGAQTRAELREQKSAERTTDAARLHALSDEMREVIGRLGGVIDPCDADPAFPLLLLPVRIETRFSADGASLRVRIFPDDVHIDQLDRGLSDTEQEAGRAYWTAVWHGADGNGELDTAWRALVERVGATRSLWTALALQPENLDRRGTDPAPEFGKVGPRTKRAAGARLLPDSFTVVALQGAERGQQTGRPIAPALTVGLFADDGSELKTVNGVRMVAGAEWIADYDEAERIGMAVTVALPRPPAKVDQLFVFGVRRSIDPKKLPGELESLLLAHRCTRGLAFVPQGTPTNNTESTRSAWQRRPEPRPPAADPSPPPAAGTNASVLAAALGIDAASLADVPHAADREQPLAKAANVALWEPTWGGFLDKINVVDRNGATLSDATREQVRQFHRDHVRGRGPLPALRVGNQPYGVLPVSNLGPGWQNSDGFEQGLLDLLRPLRDKWRSCLPGVPRVGPGDIDRTMRELLGASPVSVALRVRTVLSDEVAQVATKITGTATTDLAVERMIDELIWEEIIANASLVRRTGSLAAESRPLALPLVDDKNDAAAITKIMAGESPTVTSVLQALVTLAWDRATREQKSASGNGRLAEIVRGATAVEASARDRVLAMATRAEGLDASAFYGEAEALTRAAGAETVPTLAEYQPVSALRQSFGEMALASTTAESRAALGLFGTVSWLNAAGRLAELRDALAELSRALDADAIPQERRILIAETLDLASHRLDAWLTGIVERRRAAQRARQPDGLSIGAYGWLEGIAPANGSRADGGFVHAPSLAHATTAGILRSAYLSHNADPTGSGAFAIDLTSARVRTALHLLDGIRAGQPLAALLGYRIERQIHEAKLDRLILSLRTIAPLTQGKLNDRGDSVTQQAIEALAASNVTDGIQLIEKYQGKVERWDANRIRDKLKIGPTNNPYLTGDWPALTDAEWGRVAAIIDDAAAACDAVADLLMAESVHQMAQGNVSRASAALDAAGSGDAPPPEPEVVTSPAAGVPLTHRVLLVASGDASWSATRPRAKAAPRLEAWAATRLGDPATIIVAADTDGTLKSMADSGLCALDLIYDAADRAAFEQRLRAALPTVAADTPLFDSRADDWPVERRAIGDIFELAASLRALFVSARPASPLDLAVPNAEGTRGVDSAEVQAVHARVRDAAALFEVRAQMLDALLDADPVDADALRDRLEDLAAFGVVMPIVAANSLTQVAEAALAEAHRRLKTVGDALAKEPTNDTVIAAGQAVFGDGFWTVPAIAPPATGDAWQSALGPEAVSATRAEIRRYLADAASVRDGVRRFSEALLLEEAIGAAPTLQIAQVTGVGGTAPAGWIGLPLDPAEPTPNLPVSSVVVDASAPYDGSGETVALVVDQWVDVLPVRERRGNEPEAPVDERVTSGVSFNANAASARAPQAMLLAISPDGARWTADSVFAMLADVLDLAKIRAVTLERTNGVARVLPALYEQSWSLQGEKALDLRFVAENVMVTSAIAAYVKENAP